MPTTTTSTEATTSNETVYRKRDRDPVRVYKDRVVYYPTGVVGDCDRKTERLKGRTLAETEAAVRGMLAELAAPPTDELTMFKLMRHYIAHAEATNAEEATVLRYRVAFNSLPETIRSSRKPIAALDLHDWGRILDFYNSIKAGAPTITAAKTMLGALESHALEHDLIGSALFGDSELRNRRFKKAVSKAEAYTETERRHGRIATKHCPTTGAVEAFADAFERYYPGYGRRLVLLAYATGMRPSELLGLRWDDIEFGEDEITVSVRRQMKRKAAWLATKPTKNRRNRETIVWACYGWVAESLVADAKARTGKHSEFLFPNLAEVEHWPEEFDKWTRAATKAAGSLGWRWTFRWLRHSFATKSLSPQEYNFELHRVSEWLGHHAPSLTVDTYVHVSAPESRTRTVAQATAAPPR